MSKHNQDPMPTTVLDWLRLHKHGDTHQMALALPIGWLEIEQELQRLRIDGFVWQHGYRWDGSQVWELCEPAKGGAD